MTELKTLEFGISWLKVKQTRVHILCTMRLPQEVRDRTPREQVVKCHGAFLLSFTTPPQVGDVFPFEGQIWRIKNYVQFPARFKSKGQRYPAIAELEWVESYESTDKLFASFLYFE
jgi:hypothetical protein